MTIHFLLAAFSHVVFNSAAESQSPVDRCLATLLRTDPNTFWRDLEQSRSTAVPTEFKMAVLATLPAKGEIRSLKEPARHKLAAIQQILSLHGRESVYEIKVIDVPDAFVGLHARSVILISEPALNLLSVEELQASVAHEAGHEYVWVQYEAARERKDFERLQELEMFCDIVSVVTLRRAGLDPSRLITCFEELLRYSHERFAPHPNESHYVSPGERRKFIQTVIRWAAGGEPARAQ
jgi:hypothetical protein